VTDLETSQSHPRGTGTEVFAMDALVGLLRDHIADRWMPWRALQWCAHLADTDVYEFEHALLQMPRVAASGVRLRAIDAHGGRFAEDARLEAALARLSGRQRLLLSLLQQGCTYRETAVVLAISDEAALREIQSLLSYLTSALDPER
jgi:hypothetical protein